MLLLFEQQAIKLRDGWNIIYVSNAEVLPRLNSWSTSPPSAEKIFMRVPFTLHVAINVPSGLTAMKPRASSWA